MTGYFVAKDAHHDLWVWRESGDRPEPVLAQRAVSDLTLWDAIVALVEEES